MSQPACRLLVTFVSLLVCGLAAADEPAAPADTTAREPVRFVTEHEGTFGGHQLRYRATAGETFLKDDDGEPRASIFSFAYTLIGDHDAASRPVTFVWNGGPGSSSVWLHMGTYGPKRVVVPDAQDDGAPPYPLIANTETVLDVTDLVFVDPVGTGFSHAVGSHEDKAFWGLTEDASAIAAFVSQWITTHERWASPKLLAGESFGTMRAVAVAAELEQAHGLSVNGLMLISQALDYAGSTPQYGNFISHVTYLPTMAATAWYHRRVPDRPASLEAFLDEARAFAIGEYAPALLRGTDLSAAEREHIRRRLARFTGLSERYIERADLRVLGGRFLKELLRDQGLAVGRLDGRYTGDDVDDLGEEPDGDPSFYGIRGAYTAALQDYMASDLGVAMDRRYKASGGRDLGAQWRWRTVPDGSYWEPTSPNVGPVLGRLMRQNTDLQVWVANGYYDFATPFYDAEYTFRRHGIVPDRVTMTYYQAGHMMYLHDPSRQQFLADTRAFLRAAVAEAAPTSGVP